ncbi:uncharacterized protein ACNS7B_023660 isoform 2-T5 [Menidia menidia]
MSNLQNRIVRALVHNSATRDEEYDSIFASKLPIYNHYTQRYNSMGLDIHLFILLLFFIFLDPTADELDDFFLTQSEFDLISATEREYSRANPSVFHGELDIEECEENPRAGVRRRLSNPQTYTENRPVAAGRDYNNNNNNAALEELSQLCTPPLIAFSPRPPAPHVEDPPEVLEARAGSSPPYVDSSPRVSPVSSPGTPPEVLEARAGSSPPHGDSSPRVSPVSSPGTRVEVLGAGRAPPAPPPVAIRPAFDARVSIRRARREIRRLVSRVEGLEHHISATSIQTRSNIERLQSRVQEIEAVVSESTRRSRNEAALRTCQTLLRTLSTEIAEL